MTPDTVVTRFQQVEPGNYRQEIESLWEAAARIKDAVTEEVEGGSIPTVVGVGITACLTGQIFGYQAFHGEPTQADLLTVLTPRLMSGSGSQRS